MSQILQCRLRPWRVLKPHSAVTAQPGWVTGLIQIYQPPKSKQGRAASFVRRKLDRPYNLIPLVSSEAPSRSAESPSAARNAAGHLMARRPSNGLSIRGHTSMIVRVGSERSVDDRRFDDGTFWPHSGNRGRTVSMIVIRSEAGPRCALSGVQEAFEDSQEWLHPRRTNLASNSNSKNC